MTDQKLPEEELSSRHLAAYPRSPLIAPASERLQALLDVYYGLGLPYLGTLGLGAALFVLAETADDITAFAIVFLPLIAAIWSYPYTRKLSFGATLGPTAASSLSVGVAVIMVAAAVIAAPFTYDGSAVYEMGSLIVTLLLGTAGFPMLRLIASRHIRKLTPGCGLFLRRPYVQARIESLQEEEPGTVLTVGVRG